MVEPTPIERASQSFASLLADIDALTVTLPLDGRALLVDGSMYSPSTRAISGAEAAWDSSNDEEWEQFEGELEGLIEDYEQGGWALVWEDGCLWLYGPDHDHEQDD